MPEETHKKRGRPPKNTINETIEINSVNKFTDDNSKEFNSFRAVDVTSAFGFDIFSCYSPKAIANMIKNPMVYNEQLRNLSNKLYSANGLLTQCIDYCTAMPTLDFVVIPNGKNKQKKERNKSLMLSSLKTIRHKEIARDNLFKDMIDGVAFYYFETTVSSVDNRKSMSDYEVQNILELNEIGVNAAIIPLPTNFTKIVGRRNSSYVLAFNLDYFKSLDENELNRKLRLYPQEIRDGWDKYNKKLLDGNWLVLDNTKTICTKVRSKLEEPWGRPLCLAAIKDILYSDYFNDSCRKALDEQNSKIYIQTLPQGKEPGVCALTKKQQEDQHNTVKSAILNKRGENATTFFTVAAGTKIDYIQSNLDILDEDKSNYLNDQIGLDLGFMANLLTGTGSGSYAAQQNNLELLLSEILMWLEPFTEELVKVINENIIKDPTNYVDLYYLPCSRLTRQDFTNNMKDLYLSAGGSKKIWIASTGINVEAYLTVLDEEIESGFDEKYPPHPTSYTLSSNDVGRPSNDDSNNENTIISKANNANDKPSPSDK